MLQSTFSETTRIVRLKNIGVLHQKTNILKKLDNRDKVPVLVHNLSGKVLTDDQVQLLQKDTQFNTNDANPVDFMAIMQPIIHQINANEESKLTIGHAVSKLGFLSQTKQ